MYILFSPCLSHHIQPKKLVKNQVKPLKIEMWANAQRDGRPAKYRLRLLFNATKFG